MTTPNNMDELDRIFQELFPGYMGAAKNIQVNEAKQAISALMERERAFHMSDLARAVGLLEGLGHPDQYLTKRLVTLTQDSKDQGGKK